MSMTAFKMLKVTLTHSHSEGPKQKKRPHNSGNEFRKKSSFWKLFEGEMLNRSQTTTLLQMFYEISLLNFPNHF